MELKNREENFNKIFSEIKPVMVTTGEGDLCCVKEIRDDVLDPEKTEEVFNCDLLLHKLFEIWFFHAAMPSIQ